jgi:hypothetical protein
LGMRSGKFCAGCRKCKVPRVTRVPVLELFIVLGRFVIREGAVAWKDCHTP